MTGAFVLAAGGTGGHLFPAAAVAGELIGSGRRVVMLTDARSEALAGAVAGVDIRRVRAGRFDGGPVRAVRGIGELAAGVLQTRGLLRRLAPAAVLGFGGYASLPTMLAATRLGLPTLIHEQNAVLGRANRLLAARARRIATGFSETRGLRPPDRLRAVHTGNPVRPAILAAAHRAYEPPSEGGTIELLILGGSQGARIFSSMLPPALAALPGRLRPLLKISQQARIEDLARVAQAYAEYGIAAELQSFFEDVPARLARAHLVVCRAGASTLAELAVMSRPAVLVPYPHAAEDHQTANARAFAEAGAGWLVAQSELSPQSLADRLLRLFDAPGALAAAARSAGGLARHDAAHRLAELALGLVPATSLQGCAA